MQDEQLRGSRFEERNVSEINQCGHMAGLRSGTVSDVRLLYFREEDQLCKTTITNINNNSVCFEQKANLQ